jgi:hypothetical protein
MNNRLIKKILARGGALSLILFPVLLMASFGLHFERLADFFVFKVKYVPNGVSETMATFSGPNAFRLFILPHLVGYFSFPFMIFSSLALAYVLFKQRPWFGIIGAALTCIGSVFLAGLFAIWLSFAAIGNVPAEQIESSLPALAALTQMQGFLSLTTSLSGLGLLGLLILGIGLFKSTVVPRWSGALVVLGTALIMIFTDLDNWMFIGALCIFIGCIPVALKLWNL